MLLLASSVCGLFKWRQFEPEVILLAVGWYLRFSLSYRGVEELLAERGLRADHVTVWRWVQRYAPELERRPRALWWRIASIARCNISTMYWNRITGRSSVGSARVSIFVPSGELGARSPAMKRFI